MQEHLIAKVKSFLVNYESDLDYNRHNDLSSLNSFTCGTPYFNTYDEADEYLTDLRTTIELAKGN